MNHLTGFLLPARGVRGFAVELHDGLHTMFGWRHYPPDVARELGLALAATPLLAADMTQDGRFNLQFQGKGPLKLLVTQIDQDLSLRGMAKHAPDAEGDFQALMRGGLLAAMMEPRQGDNRYQAMVEVLGEGLSESLQIYFGRSEQIQTQVRLAASPGKLAGLLVQRLPEAEGHHDDDWEHVYTLFRTVTAEDLLRWSAAELLQRLFAEDEVRVFAPRPVTLACQCSHAQISAMLLGLGRDEVDGVLREQGQLGVTCEFCGREYRYTPAEAHALFDADTAAGAGQTRQ
jgi:molecular chaperone Hsp33